MHADNLKLISFLFFFLFRVFLFHSLLFVSLFSFFQLYREQHTDSYKINARLNGANYTKPGAQRDCKGHDITSTLQSIPTSRTQIAVDIMFIIYVY